MPDPYTYVFVRKDISLAQQIVQSGHAALQAGFRFQEPQAISSLIILQVKDQAELAAAFEDLSERGIQVEPFYEPDFDMGFSAFATEPLYTNRHRGYLAHYPLWNHD